MTHFNPPNVGLAVGLFLGAWHALWSILVATGLAQALIDLVLWLHFIRPVFVIDPFEPLRALLLVGFTTLVGFIIGYGLALVWNAIHRASPQ